MYSFNIFYVMQYLIFILHYLTIIRKNLPILSKMSNNVAFKSFFLVLFFG